MFWHYNLGMHLHIEMIWNISEALMHYHAFAGEQNNITFDAAKQRFSVLCDDRHKDRCSASVVPIGQSRGSHIPIVREDSPYVTSEGGGRVTSCCDPTHAVTPHKLQPHNGVEPATQGFVCEGGREGHSMLRP